VSNFKPHGISKSNLKFLNIDTGLRDEKRREWNQPVLWPLLCLFVLLLLVMVPGYRAYKRRLDRKVVAERMP